MISGLTFMFIIGAPIWPRVEISKNILRIVVGPFSFWILSVDMEVFFSGVLKERKEKTNLSQP